MLQTFEISISGTFPVCSWRAFNSASMTAFWPTLIFCSALSSALVVSNFSICCNFFANAFCFFDPAKSSSTTRLATSASGAADAGAPELSEAENFQPPSERSSAVPRRSGFIWPCRDSRSHRNNAVKLWLASSWSAPTTSKVHREEPQAAAKRKLPSKRKSKSTMPKGDPNAAWSSSADKKHPSKLASDPARAGSTVGSVPFSCTT
mmetsp:Transcript_99079/g.251557  ORF Transcript_99079/g.251557 Transcript_99079/m.251557 type:complete len:206 (-) Transcript_99079:1311-1928(-)